MLRLNILRAFPHCCHTVVKSDHVFPCDAQQNKIVVTYGQMSDCRLFVFRVSDPTYFLETVWILGILVIRTIEICFRSKFLRSQVSTDVLKTFMPRVIWLIVFVPFVTPNRSKCKRMQSGSDNGLPDASLPSQPGPSIPISVRFAFHGWPFIVFSWTVMFWPVKVLGEFVAYYGS